MLPGNFVSFANERQRLRGNDRRRVSRAGRRGEDGLQTHQTDPEHDQQGDQRLEGATGEVGAADLFLLGEDVTQGDADATKIRPLSAAAAPTAAMKKSCHVSGS